MFDVGRTLIAAVARDPGALAVVEGPLRLDYAALLERSLRLVAGLDRLGLQRGDHLLAIMQNTADMVTLHWATQLAGIIITPINWRAKAEEIDYFAGDAEARALVFDCAAADAVADSSAAAGLPRIAAGGAAGGTCNLDELLREAPAAAIPRAQAEDWSLMFYTSGTTGRGKGVPRRHRAERAAALAHVAQNAYGPGEVTLGVMPLYHTMGVRSLLAMALINGAFICLPRFDAAAALALIQRERVSNLYLVPTLYHDLLAAPDFAATDIGSVRKLGFAGAAMTDGLLQKLAAAFRPELFVNHYGSSEIYTYTIDRDAPAKPGSAGRAGLNTEIRVVRLGSTDPDALAAVGEEGQIAATLHGDEAFEGYWKRPEADARAIHGGWFFTGDVGYRDAEGSLFVTGRVDDMVITGGENVLPAEIESVLSLHPQVVEVAVAGLPDERWGQAVTAFVVRADGVDEATLDAHCRESELANFKRPRRYVFVAAIPKSPVGKVLRRLLVAGDYQPEGKATGPQDQPR